MLLLHYKPTVEPTCGPYHFYCTVVVECIDDELVCNGVSDCKDGTDEELLSCGEHYTLLLPWIILDIADFIKPIISCDPKMFQCSDMSRCVAPNQHCDNHNHCADGSDESNCCKLMFVCVNVLCLSNNVLVHVSCTSFYNIST